MRTANTLTATCRRATRPGALLTGHSGIDLSDIRLETAAVALPS